ncbi:MAG: GIY-YIG nuclease family protein [Bacteroidetes bacterium]|nr:GIY-YIG nuclease family protein [Bacteroidota bacterium]
MELKSFTVYILYSVKLDRFYIGTTDNIEKRIIEHNSGKYDDSYTLRGVPWEMFLQIDGLSSKQAYQIEGHIKMKSKNYIRSLSLYPELIEKLKNRYDSLVRPR